LDDRQCVRVGSAQNIHSLSERQPRFQYSSEEELRINFSSESAHLRMMLASQLYQPGFSSLMPTTYQRQFGEVNTLEMKTSDQVTVVPQREYYLAEIQKNPSIRKILTEYLESLPPSSHSNQLVRANARI
jgi:hypothetical protein